MQKKWYLFSTLVLILFIMGCCYLSTNKQVIESINSSALSYNSITHQVPIAKLIIPKINLENDLYDIGTKENNVDRNVTLLEPSVFPDMEQSILFIAAHSGSGDIAYFKNLDMLKLNDEVNFIYKNNNYTYKIVDIFEEEKDGDIEINRISTHQLVLTTCSEKHKGMQLIINTKLVKKEEI